MSLIKPQLSFWQIVNMNVGFFGIQYSFGLQQSNMSPIYKYLGADEASLPYLWLAGPMTGLIVQPIIGAMSDKTISKMGRRTPFFLIGRCFAASAYFLCPLAVHFGWPRACCGFSMPPTISQWSLIELLLATNWTKNNIL